MYHSQADETSNITNRDVSTKCQKNLINSKQPARFDEYGMSSRYTTFSKYGPFVFEKIFPGSHNSHEKRDVIEYDITENDKTPLLLVKKAKVNRNRDVAYEKNDKVREITYERKRPNLD